MPAKQIRSFLKMDKKEEFKERPKHRYFFLDDILDNDLSIVCPNCESGQVRSLHTHNVDGHDYECNRCRLTYSVMLYDRADDV